MFFWRKARLFSVTWFIIEGAEKGKVSENQGHILELFQKENFGIFFNSDSLHARLKGHYKAWSYKKKNHKKIKAYTKSV